jgi:Protein of unknown function (DUF4236)
MGLSFARSVKLGAVRFNFSGSGIGISTGIKGLRVGTGPRGAYISGGFGGFRYHQSLGGKQRVRPSPATRTVHVPLGSQDAAHLDPNIVATTHHETKNVLELQDCTSDALLQSINEQRHKMAIWPIALVVLGGLFMFLLSVGSTWPTGLHLGVLAVFAGVVLWLRWRDKMRKLTVLFYEPDEPTHEIYSTLATALRQAASAAKLKAVANTSQYGDTKYSAGASQGLKFAGAALFLGQAPGVIANIDVPILKAAKTTLALYPDRVLAFQGNAVGGISYQRLQAESLATRFIEHEAVPSDARVVDRTWQYVNKKGGPDRRFKNNRELPVCIYSQLNPSTPDGLDVRFMGSKEGAFDELSNAIDLIRLHLARAGRQAPGPEPVALKRA